MEEKSVHNKSESEQHRRAVKQAESEIKSNLIALVGQHPDLYDKTCDLYKDKIRQQNVWNQIGKSVGRKYTFKSMVVFSFKL